MFGVKLSQIFARARLALLALCVSLCSGSGALLLRLLCLRRRWGVSLPCFLRRSEPTERTT